MTALAGEILQFPSVHACSSMKDYLSDEASLRLDRRYDDSPNKRTSSDARWQYCQTVLHIFLGFYVNP